MKMIGIIFGKFYPLHIGHIYFIQRAYGQVKKLHIIIGYEKHRDDFLFQNSKMSKKPNIKDRIRWLLQTFKYQKNIFVHSFDEEKIISYPKGWYIWSKNIKKFMQLNNILPNIIFTSEKQDVKNYKKYLNMNSILIDPERKNINISSTKIRKNPFFYWQYIPIEVRSFFVKTVVIIGGESSGKSILVNKLANIFNTTSACEFGREYIYSHLGGSEKALQHSDYYKIALGQARYIDHAIKYANKITFIDTDFITTQAFHKKYEGYENLFVKTLINMYKFNLFILLENNTPWIADGIRSLGNPKERIEFQKILIDILKKNQIKYERIKNKNYDFRFLKCIKLIKKILKVKL